MTSYKDAGVDIVAGEEAVQQMKQHMKQTFTKQVLSDIGGFGGLFELPAGYKQPVLVSSADGVGTKLKVAMMSEKHATVGQDLVNHCVNDILVQGAKPLFFMDYIGAGIVDKNICAQVAKGLSQACAENGCALLGGETAEMPGLYQGKEYDLAGFVLGIVEKDKIITGNTIQVWDSIIGLPSVGLHTNGYSLARKVLLDLAGIRPTDFVEELGCTLQEELLRVHKSYLKEIQLLHDLPIHGMAHITGGGLPDNVKRILPKNTAADIHISWQIPPIFSLIQEKGNVSNDEMAHTFNMGIGYVIIVSPGIQEEVMNRIPNALKIGEIIERPQEVVLQWN